jgi:hypothetical protein
MFYIGVEMSYQERNTWIFTIVAVVAYGTYVATVLTRANGAPLAHVAYVSPMLWSIGGAILASIVGSIIAAILSPGEAPKEDQRDREIYRFGEYIGQSFVVAGAIGAMGMAMGRVDYFWIANEIYLAFVLSALLASTAKFVAYRWGLPTW